MMRSSDELWQALQDGTLEPAGFSHRDHVAAAFAALQRHDFFEALWRYADGLRALTMRAGVPDKFNATVTFAFMSRIAEAMAEGFDDADAMLEIRPELLDGRLPGQWYRPDRLSSDLARRVPLMPEPAATLID